MKLRPFRSPLSLTGVVALTAFAALTVSSCGTTDPAESDPTTTASGSAGAGAESVPGSDDPALAQFYDQELTWEPCPEDSDFECSTVEVPVDYDDPDRSSIELAVARPGLLNTSDDDEADNSDDDASETTEASEAERAPALLVNPGGPGSSGVDLVIDSLAFVATEELINAYTIVGFDPRGVARSAPVQCLSDEDMDASRQMVVDVTTDEGMAQMVSAAADFATACEENSGDVLGFVDTVSAARDMDIMRHVLGNPALDYLGFSYGTKLGATYAELFPEQVGRMVLDGALDPTLDFEEVTLGQAAGFEQSIQSWAEYCAESEGCAVGTNTDDIMTTIQDLISDYAANPGTAADGRVVPADALVSGILVPLYSQDTWPMLAEGLNSALDGDPTLLLLFADLNVGRDMDGTYSSNINSAFPAINCLDYPTLTDPEALEQDRLALEEASPTFGTYLAYSAITCGAWPFEQTNTLTEFDAAGAAPIVVVGTTGDPATPYDWSPALAEQLESGVLVTSVGEGHGAYPRASSCLAETVDAYFIDGTVPENGLTCE